MSVPSAKFYGHGLDKRQARRAARVADPTYTRGRTSAAAPSRFAQRARRIRDYAA